VWLLMISWREYTATCPSVFVLFLICGIRLFWDKSVEFPQFYMVNIYKLMNIGIFSISSGEPHYRFAPTLPQ